MIYNYDGTLEHKEKSFQVARYYERVLKNKKEFTHKPILMTESVYKGVLKEEPDMKSVKEGWIKEDKNIKIPGCKEKVYGVNSWFKDFE